MTAVAKPVLIQNRAAGDETKSGSAYQSVVAVPVTTAWASCSRPGHLLALAGNPGPATGGPGGSPP